MEDEEEQEVMVSHQTADGAETRPEVGVMTRSLVWWSHEGWGGGLTFHSQPPGEVSAHVQQGATLQVLK